MSKQSMIILMIFCLLLISACTQEPEAKMEEPTINVKLADGNIKKIKIEEYVAGVVAGEMNKNWSKNTYAAQAIIARTFTLKRLEENGDNTISGRHEEAQAYKPENIIPEIEEAVKMTRGEVITHKDKYIQGWFHSSAGGQTTTADVGLAYKDGNPPYIHSVKSPDEEAPEDIKNWKLVIGKGEVLQALQKTGEVAQGIKGIEILKKDKTGRVINLKIIHDQGEKELAAAEFRTLIGSDKLKSTLIKELRQENNQFIFKGSGYGHGVGMSQWGAYKMGQDGKSPEDIIRYYFKDVKIVNKWK